MVTQFVMLGLLRFLPARIQTILLERSILDIFSDMVYFPIVAKTIGAFIRTIIVKP